MSQINKLLSKNAFLARSTLHAGGETIAATTQPWDCMAVKSLELQLEWADDGRRRRLHADEDDDDNEEKTLWVEPTGRRSQSTDILRFHTTNSRRGEISEFDAILSSNATFNFKERCLLLVDVPIY
jgi:hypothetical protein